ncbi:MAG: sulfite exporter TauE/SafE family protein, partial [Gammaproteobacteria bacterium]|nr:sulfite exporter TauE/SafE family protein [Gammaproteobacteria bacterium]
MLSWMILPLLGIIVGTLSGLLGIGGGVIMVPMLAMILPVLGVEPKIAIHLALGSSMATSFLTLLSSVIVYSRKGVVDREVFKSFLPGIIFGAVTGPCIVHLLSAVILKVIIGIIMLALACNMAFDYEIPATRKLPSKKIILISGLVIGVLSSFAGLSGAALIVPYLVWFGLGMSKAVGIAATCGLPLSFIGTLSYM